MLPSVATERNTFYLLTLLCLNKRLLRVFPAYRRDASSHKVCSHRVRDGTRMRCFLSSKQRGHNYPFSPSPPQAASLHFHIAVPGMQHPPSVTPPAPLRTVIELRSPSAGLSFPTDSLQLQRHPTASEILRVLPLLKLRAEIFSFSFSLWWTPPEKSSVILWRTKYKNKLYRIK